MKIRNRMIILVASIFCLGVLSACANANGLHNQMASEVTFVFQNFPENVTGEYSIPGNFNDWDNTKTMINMKNGNGTSQTVTISDANIQFTLVKTGEWLRGWNEAVTSNGFDASQNKYHNFYIDALDLSSGEIILVIDGSDETAEPRIKE